MSKRARITLWAVSGTIAVLLITLCVLLGMGFRFSSEAAVHEYYRNFPVIHTDEYDFYVEGVTIETVKKYGFLYKNISEESHHLLVAENGEKVGYLYTYRGKAQNHYIITWAPSDITHTEEATVITRKYWTEKITLNGKETALELACYFATDEPIETLVIKDTKVSIVDVEW